MQELHSVKQKEQCTPGWNDYFKNPKTDLSDACKFSIIFYFYIDTISGFPWSFYLNSYLSRATLLHQFNFYIFITFLKFNFYTTRRKTHLEKEIFFLVK